MASRILTLIVVALLATWALTGRGEGTEGEAKGAAADVVTDKVNGLRIELKKPRMVTDEVPYLAVDFVMVNETHAPITLVRRETSTGSRQWSFTVLDGAGKSWTLHNPMWVWISDVFDVFSIEPQKSYSMSCRVFLANEDAMPPRVEGIEYFGIAAPFQKKTVEPWVYPLTVTGHFAATLQKGMVGADMWIRSNWQGTLQTAAVTLTPEMRVSRPEDPDPPPAPLPDFLKELLPLKAPAPAP